MALRIIRRLSTAAWLAAVLGCLALVGFARLNDAVVIVGGSMEPTIPRGSVVDPVEIDGHPAVGDVVTVRADNGVLVTHRVTRLLDLADGWFVELQGDANPSPDPALVPASAIVGRVDGHVPHAGYLLAMLSTPLGWLSVVATLGAAALGLMVLDDLERAGARQTHRRVASRAPSR